MLNSSKTLSGVDARNFPTAEYRFRTRLFEVGLPVILTLAWVMLMLLSGSAAFILPGLFVTFLAIGISISTTRRYQRDRLEALRVALREEGFQLDIHLNGAIDGDFSRFVSMVRDQLIDKYALTPQQKKTARWSVSFAACRAFDGGKEYIFDYWLTIERPSSEEDDVWHDYVWTLRGKPDAAWLAHSPMSAQEESLAQFQFTLDGMPFYYWRSRWISDCGTAGWAFVPAARLKACRN